MSRRDALRKELKALEWLRDKLQAQHPGGPHADEARPSAPDLPTVDPKRVDAAEYSDLRKVYRN